MHKTFTYRYHSDKNFDEIEQIISGKLHGKPGSLRKPKYSGTFYVANHSFMLVKRGSSLPLIIQGSIEPGSKTVELKFRSLINPFFIVIPIAIFMIPTLVKSLTMGTGKHFLLFIATLLGFTLLAFLLTYISIRTEKAKLEKEMHLEPLPGI